MTDNNQSTPTAGITGSATTRRPRVWFVTRCFGRPSEAWMHRQAALMTGSDLTVVAYRYEHQEQFPADGFSIEMVRGAVKPTGNLLTRQLKFAGRRWRNRQFGSFRGTAHEARWWGGQLRANRPDVALIQYGTTAVELLPLLERFRVPVVVHFHGMDLSGGLNQPVYRRRLMRLAGRFAACVVVADYMRDWLLEHGVDADRIHKIPCGTPLGSLPVAQRVGEPPCRCLAVGRLVDKKRPDLTIRAFAKASEDAPDATLTIIGDGPLRVQCEAIATELNASERVHFLGAQPPSRVFEEIKNASLFVQHCVTAPNGDKEGWPVAIAEAAGSGLPVVSTRHSSIPEQVEHGRTGLLCDEGDWRAMAENLLALMNDPPRREQMGAAAREKLAPFDTKNQVEQLENLLHGVAREHA